MNENCLKNEITHNYYLKYKENYSKLVLENPQLTKICNKCNQSKNLEMFGYGRLACRDCVNKDRNAKHIRKPIKPKPTTRTCKFCNVTDDINSNRWQAQMNSCKTCYRDNVRRQWEKDNFEKVKKRRQEFHNENPQNRLISYAKHRAKINNIPFNLSPKDIEVPKLCPVLGMPLKLNNGSLCKDSPSLDRIIPAKGYVKGNVKVISHRANTLKNDATIQELEKVIEYMKKNNCN